RLWPRGPAVPGLRQCNKIITARRARDVILSPLPALSRSGALFLGNKGRRSAREMLVLRAKFHPRSNPAIARLSPDMLSPRTETAVAPSRELAARFEAYSDWRRRLSAGISGLHEWLAEQDLADASIDLRVQHLLERLHQDK